jgi:hypothetical protein
MNALDLTDNVHGVYHEAHEIEHSARHLERDVARESAHLAQVIELQRLTQFGARSEGSKPAPTGAQPGSDEMQVSPSNGDYWALLELAQALGSNAFRLTDPIAQSDLMPLGQSILPLAQAIIDQILRFKESVPANSAPVATEADAVAQEAVDEEADAAADPAPVPNPKRGGRR